ncbi:hypothetical protein diail_2771 [Diaporthe ilicicola]|nr:hypothetical protein diail_2771 [Diaporthe ilicicola]
MLMGRASTFPPSSDRQSQPTRASSEHEARSEPRASVSDEAQACFNLVLILRNDTQYLISLRNDNLQAFEEIDTARPLLSQINGAITAATRSIHELGPFLERHRWPSSEPPRASIIRLKVLRKRSRSLSSPVSAPAPAPAGDPGLSPDELFSWTLELTAQHAAVLAAVEQLENFLVYGSADISEDDRRRHDATGSWWQQRHSEFENVTLIQSILQRPRRNLKGLPGATVTTPAADMAESAQIGIAVTTSSPAAAAMMPGFTDHDDGRSETLTFSEQSIRSWPGEMMYGLTARPRTRNRGTPEAHPHLTYKPLDLRIIDPGPAAYPQSSPPPAMRTEQCPGPPSHSDPEQAKEARQEISGTEGPLMHDVVTPGLPLSRFNSSVRRPRIATTPLPPLVGLQALIPDISQRARSATLDLGHSVSPLSPSSPMLSPPGLSRHSSRVSLPSPIQASPTVDTPFTPLNQQVATMFEQRTLPSKTIQPVIHELDHMIASPVYSMQPAFELDVSPVANSHCNQSPARQEDDKHWPYLAYMARKQAVTMSRWSVRSSKSTKSKEAKGS